MVYACHVGQNLSHNCSTILQSLIGTCSATETWAMKLDSPVVRQWILLRLLGARRHGISVHEMAAETGVHEKTIRRDLAALRVAGFPLDEAVEPHGRKAWRLRFPDQQPELCFAIDEALALYLGRRLLEPLAGTLLWEAAQSAFRKVRACLGPAALTYLDKMSQHLHHTSVGRGDYSRKAEIIDGLMQAIEDRKATHLVYQSARSTEPVTYEVCPYAIAYHRGSLYLVAHSHEHDSIRHFKIDRINEVEVSAFPFRLPDDFDVREHFAGSFGVYHGDGDITVKVRFLPAVARYVEESVWHDSQHLSPQRDGSLLATFCLSSTEEIKRWLLSFGRQAIVVEPEQLQRDIVAECEAVAAEYLAVQKGTTTPENKVYQGVHHAD